MSNEKPSESGTPLGNPDTIIVWDEGEPVVIIAASDRAGLLFARWGVDKDMDGIKPPADAMDFIQSLPMDWICGMGICDKLDYKVQEIPLPQPLIVLH